MDCVHNLTVKELDGYMEIFNFIYDDFIFLRWNNYINSLSLQELEDFKKLKSQILCKHYINIEDKLNKYLEENKDKMEKFKIYKKYINLNELKKNLLNKHCSLFDSFLNI